MRVVCMSRGERTSENLSMAYDRKLRLMLFAKQPERGLQLFQCGIHTLALEFNQNQGECGLIR